MDCQIGHIIRRNYLMVGIYFTQVAPTDCGRRPHQQRHI
jgi:hypothetical protein